MSTSKRDTDQDWVKVAEDDPYWGVLSQDEYKADVMTEEKLVEFMASGELFMSNLFSLVRAHLLPNFAPARGLDLGCGVGRLLLPMAKRVGEAVGVDIAPAMLKICEENLAKVGVTNIQLALSDDTLSKVSGKFDLVNSYIVLQHIPPDRGYRLIDAMLSALNIGGIGSLQLTYAKSRNFLIHETPKAQFYRREGGTLIDIVDSGWSPPEGTINMFDYDLNQIMAQLTRVCGAPILVLPTNDDSHLGVHFVFQKARGK